LYSIDPEATSLALQGATGTGLWQEQSSDSLSDFFFGWLVVDVFSSSMVIIPGSTLVADQSNSWQPGTLGSVTASPASYGAKAVIGTGIGANNLTMALRNLAFDVQSDYIDTSSDPIDASSVSFAVSTSNAVLDYRANGLVIFGGSHTLASLSATNAGGSITMPIAIEVQTLNIPVDITCTTQVLTTNDTTLHFTGTIVAHRGLNILNRHLIWYLSADGQQLTLIWDASLKLQQATTLSPPDWTDFSGDPPATIPIGGVSGFFRVATP
jgi:hypothetical protein